MGGKEVLLSVKTMYTDMSTEMERQTSKLDYQRNAAI